MVACMHIMLACTLSYYIKPSSEREQQLADLLKETHPANAGVVYAIVQPDYWKSHLFTVSGQVSLRCLISSQRA
jgi:hypothetical protein